MGLWFFEVLSTITVHERQYAHHGQLTTVITCRSSHDVIGRTLNYIRKGVITKTRVNQYRWSVVDVYLQYLYLNVTHIVPFR